MVTGKIKMNDVYVTLLGSVTSNVTPGTTKVSLSESMANYRLLIIESYGYNNYFSAVYPADLGTGIYWVDTGDSDYRLGLSKSSNTELSVSSYTGPNVQKIFVYGIR